MSGFCWWNPFLKILIKLLPCQLITFLASLSQYFKPNSNHFSTELTQTASVAGYAIVVKVSLNYRLKPLTCFYYR